MVESPMISDDEGTDRNDNQMNYDKKSLDIVEENGASGQETPAAAITMQQGSFDEDSFEKAEKEEADREESNKDDFEVDIDGEGGTAAEEEKDIVSDNSDEDAD